MTILILGAALTLSIFPGAWPCASLTVWLLRHRRIKVPCYRAAKAASAHQGTGEANGHPRAKPDWVRQQVIYLAVHLGSCRKITHAFNRWHGQDASGGKSWVAEFIKAPAATQSAPLMATQTAPPGWGELTH